MTAPDDTDAVLGGASVRPDVSLAEKAVLGSMIAYRDAAERVLDVLDRDECFATAEHQHVYAAIRSLAEAGQLNERGTLAAGEEQQSRFAAVLSRCIASGVGVWHTGDAGVIVGSLMRYATASYMTDAAKVMSAARARRTLAASVTVRQLAADPGFDPDESGDLIRKLIDEALEGRPADTSAVTAADLFMSALDRLESPEPPGLIQFPWAELRRLVPYLRPGQLVTIAARPSLGKSLIAQDLVRYVGLRKQIPCVLFSLEQDRDEVMDRFIAAEAGVLLERIIAKDLDDAAWSRIAAAKERFDDSRLVIDDTPKATPAHIRARLRGMARHDPAQLAVVDYLQLMGTPAGSENRQQEVTALVGSLKAIAREFRIPLVMCCQLNRGPEQRHDKRPHLSDARESGSVDNDSDVAILIHREDFYEPDSSRAGEADLLVDKNRNGPRGTATVGFQGHYARFVDPEWTPSSAIGART